MLNLRLGEIAKLSNGKLNKEEYGNIVINEISRDTRTIEFGDIYLPLIGENLNGHLFIDDAFNLGAKATFAKIGEYHKDDKPIIWVEDTLQALRQFAKNYRETLDLKVIAITGSNGKTTTKDMVAKVVSKKYNVTKTFGNLNNQIGLPITLLRFTQDTQVGVCELGMFDGKGGEIKANSDIAKPDIAVITNIGEAHLDTLITKENIAKEKLGILSGLKEDGVLIYNNDDKILKSEISKMNIKQKLISFGKDKSSDYVIEVIESNNVGSLFLLNGEAYNVSLIGEHQVYNASVAAIVGQLLEISKTDIYDAIFNSRNTTMRSELMNLNGFDILNDSYKSNPQSLRTALRTLDILSGYTRKIAILGDMLELGSNEIELHEEIGREILPENVDYLLLFGPLSKYTAQEASKNFPPNRVFYFESKRELVTKAKYLIKKGTLVLVKASRSMHMEEVIESINLLHV